MVFDFSGFCWVHGFHACFLSTFLIFTSFESIAWPLVFCYSTICFCLLSLPALFVWFLAPIVSLENIQGWRGAWDNIYLYYRLRIRGGPIKVNISLSLYR